MEAGQQQKMKIVNRTIGQFFDLNDPHDFTPEIAAQTGLLNDILSELGQPSLFENVDFVIDLCWAGLLKLDLAKAGRIPISFWLGGEFRIDVDRTREAFSIDADQLSESRDAVIGFGKTILSCSATVEHHGSYCTKIRFFDNVGQCVKSMRYTEGLCFWRCRPITRQAFAAVYDSCGQS